MISDRLPAGLTASSISGATNPPGETNEPETPGGKLACQTSPTLSCSFSGTIEPYGSLGMKIELQAKAFTGGSNEVTVSGGNAPTVTTPDEIASSEAPVPFGIERFELQPEEENGQTDNLAGSHPFALTTTLELNQILKSASGKADPAVPALLRNLGTVLPPGLIGDPLAVPECSEADFETETVEADSNLLSREHGDRGRSGDVQSGTQPLRMVVEGGAGVQPRTRRRRSRPVSGSSSSACR